MQSHSVGTIVWQYVNPYYQRFSAVDIRVRRQRVTDACCQSFLVFRCPLLFLTSGKEVVSILHSRILNCFSCCIEFLKTQQIPSKISLACPV